MFVASDIAELSAEVKSPSGRVDKAKIVQSSDNTYTIRFVPKVVIPVLMCVLFEN